MNSSKATYLITGGAGFVGSALAIAIKTAKPHARVFALDNLKRRGAELNLPRLRQASVEFLHGDIRNPGDLDAAGPIDVLLECSAEPSVLAGYNEAPQYLVDTNLTGAAHCFEHARKHNAAVVFFSTSRVYPIPVLNQLRLHETSTRFSLDSTNTIPGLSGQGIAEDFPLNGPRSLYGATKLAAELLLTEYRAMYGLKTIVNRCGLIAGPWQMGKVDQGVIVLWLARHLWGGKLDYIGYGGTGKQVRDVLHIEDLTRLVLHQLDHLEDLDGETLNVGGGGANTSLLELTQYCQELTGNSLEIGRISETRPADVPWYITDHGHATRRTGWRPEKSVQEILADILSWLREHEAALRPILG